MGDGWGGARSGAGRPLEELTPEETLRRDLARSALAGYGPASWDGTIFDDAELREHWDTWASESHAWNHLGWPETSYACQRFLRGLEVDEAIAAVERANRRHRLGSAPCARRWARQHNAITEK